MNIAAFTITKYKQMNQAAKATAWYTICNIMQRGISFLVVPIYLRMLTTSEYGRYSVFQSWKEILMIFATLNLHCGVFTKAMVDYPKDRDRYTSCMQTLSTALTMVMLVIYLPASSFWNRRLDMDTITVLMMIAYFIFYPAFLFWSTHQRVIYKYKQMVVVTLFVSILTPVLSIVFLKCTNFRENAVIWGYLLVQIAAGVFFYVYNYAKGKCIYDKDYWLHALKFNIPLIPHYLSLIALSQIDRIMIKEMCGDDKAGIYSFTVSISATMNIFISAINSAVVPWTYSQLREEKYKSISKVSNGLVIMIGIMTAGVMMIAPEIVGFLGTEEYMEAIWVIPAVTFAIYFTFVYGMFANIEFYYCATQFVTVATSVAAMANVLSNALLIPVFGYIAAGYTTLGCYILLAVMHYIFSRKICREVIGCNSVYDVKSIVLVSGLMTVAMLICIVLYSNTVLRYVTFFVAMVMIVMYRRKMISIIKQIVYRSAHDPSPDSP